MPVKEISENIATSQYPQISIQTMPCSLESSDAIASKVVNKTLLSQYATFHTGNWMRKSENLPVIRRRPGGICRPKLRPRNFGSKYSSTTRILTRLSLSLALALLLMCGTGRRRRSENLRPFKVCLSGQTFTAENRPFGRFSVSWGNSWPAPVG